MVFLKKHEKDFILLLFSIVVGIGFCYPFLLKDFLLRGHDTFFHLSRIEGLSTSIVEGIWLPRIYPHKNNGFGYASPLFYSDFLLYLPALLYRFGMPLTKSYTFYIVVISILSCFTMCLLIARITKNSYVACVLGFAYLFSNYRISDVYIRGALGECVAMVFLPLFLLGVYRLFYENQRHSTLYLTLSLSGLILSHNLTFFLTFLTFLFLILVHYKSWSKKVWQSILVSSFSAFFLTLFFTLPMLEQLASQKFILSYYSSHSALEEYSVPLWKYFANKTVFGYGSNDLDPSLSMLVNVGYFFMCMPLCYLFNKKKDFFGLLCFGMGYFFLFFPLNIFPWQAFSFLRIIQFPWRLILFAPLFLSIPIALFLTKIKYTQLLSISLIFLLGIEGIYHLQPIWTFRDYLTSKHTYADLLNGSVIDPYFSANYIRVECAGGEYFPLDYKSFKELTTDIRSLNHPDKSIPYETKSVSLYFKVDEVNEAETLVFPRTFYKRYELINLDTKKQVPVTKSNEALVEGIITEAGNYCLSYVPTFLQRSTVWISFVYLLLLLIPKKGTKVFFKLLDLFH